MALKVFNDRKKHFDRRCNAAIYLRISEFTPSTVNVAICHGRKNVLQNTVPADNFDQHQNNSVLLLLTCQLFLVFFFHFYRAQHQNLRFVAVFLLPTLLRKLCFFLIYIIEKLIHFYHFSLFCFNCDVFFYRIYILQLFI